ncbi:hypothetical protein Smp_159260 [Schistosoma mansoni]|uniref:hypothetical protein n=1 Tax=Schistosoma mansoni TaxID=6183 RepID=UPI00022DBFB0|nr:hypothetical protein Smp_159260 [Schistosoma mansoni]|eukprot:XP_018652751.1 hypothetical protein Smp_159260 [Schistosoma mansoni]
MNESFSQKHEISKALVELNYENLLINFKEKLLNIINSCQPNDYEDLMTTLYNQLECNNNNESNKHPNDLLQLMPSSSSNQYTKQSISDHNDNVSENNHFSSDETKLKTKSSRRYSTFSNSSSIMSNTLKQQINKIPHHQKNKHKDVKKSHRHEIHNNLSEQNSSKDLFQRSSLDSPSNIHNAIYSFSDADSTFSSCLNNYNNMPCFLMFFLVEYLQLQFTKNAHHYPFLKDGVDFQQNHNKCQLILINWKYALRFVNEIIGKCLNILSIGCEQFNHEQNYHQLRLTPFHLFSLVDCEAKWFIQSSHGTYCCNALIVQLKNNYELDTMKIELMDLHKFEIFVEVFQNILSHKTGQIILQNLISKPLNLISNLLDFTMKLLYQSMEMKNLSSSVDEYYVLLLNILIKIIHCGQHLNKRGTSSHFEDIHDFNSVLIKMWYQITETKLMSEINFNRIQENFLTDFQNCLIYSLGSPIGVELFTKSNLLINFTKFLQKYLVNEHNISFRRPHTCGFLFSQLALNKSSLLALSQSGIISLLVKHAWQSIEYFDSTGHVNLTGNYSTVKTYNPPIWSIDPIDKIAYKPFVNLVRVTTSYECVENLLNPMDLLTNKEYYDFRLDIPTNLPEFFDRVIFVNNNMAKLNSLFNPDQCQVFGLRLLSCIISCLDSLLWFEAYLNLSDYLLNCQNMEEYLPTNVNVMYDTLTIERNYLLMKIFFIGGPTERELPPRILCQHTNNIYPFIMIQSKPVYDNYYYCTTPESSTRIDNKCKQYPCINWYNEMFPTASIKSQLLTNLLQIELINQPITSFKTAMEWTNQCQTIFKNYNGMMKRGEFYLETNNTLCQIKGFGKGYIILGPIQRHEVLDNFFFVVYLIG